MRDALYPIYRKAAQLLGRAGLARLDSLRAVHRRLRSALTGGSVPVMGHQMLLDRADTLELASRGVHDPLETHVLVHHARPGDVVADLGAHIGYFTLLLARRVGAQGHVYAFEPDPENFRLLRRNIRLNGYENVTCVNLAVGDRTGTASLYRAPENLGDHRTYDPQEPGRERIEIGATRLDDYLHGRASRLDLVKLDVQGAEAAALDGMGDLLAGDPRPTIVLEFWPPGLRRAGAEPTTVLDRLAGLGYALHHLDEAGGHAHPIEDIRGFSRPYEAAEIYSPDREDYTSVLCIPPGGPEIGPDGAPVRKSMLEHRHIEVLLGRTLPPGDTALFVDLAYAALLGRPVDDATLERTCRRLSRGETTRRRVLRELVDSDEFRDAALLEDVLVEARDADGPFELDGPRWPGTTERVVEVPWVLTRYRGERRVLDIGYAFAESVYLTGLLGLGIPDLHGLDLSARWVPQLHGIRGDGRSLPYRDEVFDLVLCVSTLEHLGRDNVRYGVDAEKEAEGDARSLAEIGRVLAPGGRLLVTVPVGHAEDHGWFVQYDLDSWTSLVERSPLTPEEEDIFELTDDGWVRTVDRERIAKLSYADGVRGARAVLCTALRRRR